MNILSIQLGHNATVALLKDGEIVAIVSQEKFDYIKNSSSFPEKAIKWILQFAENQIDYVAIAGLTVYSQQLTHLKEYKKIPLFSYP